MEELTRTQPAQPTGYPEELRARIDDYLAELDLASRPQVAGLWEAMRYSLLAGGKRVRQVLALATAQAVDLDIDQAMPTAAALELVHTYSLIHDDLPAMDDDVLRRGIPTCHVAHGEDVAILAGDGLFAEAVRLISCEQAGAPDRVLAALGEVTRAAGLDGMVGGQYIDVAADGLDEHSLLELHELKTGRLIQASVGVSLALAGEPQPASRALRRFAVDLGVLFQIVDDILDVIGTDEQLGKPHGSDERQGKQTVVSVLGLPGARRLASERHAAALASLDQAGADTAALRRITDFIHTRQS